MTEQALGAGWFRVLEEELKQPYISELKQKLREAYTEGVVHPKAPEVFRALRLTQFGDVKVVLLGQDPYPNEHAHGLAFSSKKASVPPSLRIILREVDRSVFRSTTPDEYRAHVSSNNLTCWARQGVLLLNTVMTVYENMPGSHNDFGWQKLTTKILELLWLDERPKVFVLWGASASETFSGVMSDDGMETREHLVLSSGHPATAFHGKDLFSGNNHFLKINKFLEKVGYQPINWDVHAEEDSSSGS